MIEVISASRAQELRELPTLDRLVDEARRMHMNPGWAIGRATPSSAPSTFGPVHWRYEECKAALDAANRLVDVKQAERRNFALRNPFEGNVAATARTLACAYQSILPGESAPSHRHAAHAFRLIIEGHGSYSVVNGEKHPMETGDVVLTPGNLWHGHGHDGSGPAYWLDGLDAPLARYAGAMYFNEHPDGFEKNIRPVASSPFLFRRAEIARRLDSAKADSQGFHGPKTVFETPSMPTVGLSMERLEAGQHTRRQRSTPSRVFCVVEGTGASVVDDKIFNWAPGDVFVVPNWTRYEHRADRDSMLFCFSDEPLIRFAGYWRFEAD